jgi:dolichyl-phosphate beta-glucosyltransferase
MTDRADRTLASVEPVLSVVIPAFNEAARLNAGFARLTAALQSGAVDPATTEFIVVDDGSSDDTSGCATSLYGTLPHSSVIRLSKNRGKGAAVRAGVAAATTRTIVFADADMAIDPVQLPSFVAGLEHHHLAIGSRAAAGASVDRPSLRRSFMNRTFNHFVNALTGLSLDDTQCGFKAFRGPAARLLFHCTATERMAFDVELLVLARQLGLTITQVPVHWSRVEGSRVRSWNDAGSMVRDVARARHTLDTAPTVLGCPIRTRPDQPADDVTYLEDLSGVLPVVRRGADEVLVLFPLSSEHQVRTTAKELQQRFPAPSDELETLSVRQLRQLAPLTLTWDNTPRRSNCA